MFRFVSRNKKNEIKYKMSLDFRVENLFLLPLKLLNRLIKFLALVLKK